SSAAQSCLDCLLHDDHSSPALKGMGFSGHVNKRKEPQNPESREFQTARTKRRKKTDDRLKQYNISPLTQADVDGGDLSALNPFIATLSKDGQETLFKACVGAMQLSRCQDLWHVLHQEKKALLEANVQNWLTDLSEEDYQDFITQSQQNSLHAASAADDDDDIDEIKEAALKLYRQQSADNQRLIKAIQEERAKKAHMEAQRILFQLPEAVRAALEMQILNGLLSQGLPALPAGPETTQS
ncbi:hypothetical protein EBU95_16025, partial [bacterium]|nr:hypothetical protein [bacterium]